jgi:hypothetical protein
MKIQKVSLVVLIMLTTFVVYSNGQNSRIIDSPRENNITAVMEIVPGERIGPYTIGMSATEVQGALGEPDTIWKPSARDDFAYWIYRNESLSFHVRNQKVAGMTSLSPRHAIADGPQVGMHWETAMDQWKQALGREIIGSMSVGASKTFYFISEFNLLLEMDAAGIIREIGLEGAIAASKETEESKVGIDLDIDYESLKTIHANRIAETALDLSEYQLFDTRAYDDPSNIWSRYRLTPKNKTTTESEMVSAAKSFWHAMPTIDEIIRDYGLPPEIVMAKQNGYVFLNFFYNNVFLYFGPDSKKVLEVRFRKESTYKINGVGCGSTLEDVFAVYGDPIRTVTGPNRWEDEVLYLPDGKTGYIQYNSKGIRFFISAKPGVVSAMYLFEPDWAGKLKSPGNVTFVLADERVRSVILVTPTSVGDLDLGMSLQDFEADYGTSYRSFRGGTAEYCIYSDISVIYDSRSDYQTIVGYTVLFRNDNLVLDLENATLTSKTTYQNFEEIFVDKEIKVRVAVSTKMIVGFKDYKFEFYKFGDDPEFYLREIEISSLY